MQIVIDIPDYEYTRWKEEGEIDALVVRDALVNGTPLTGTGRWIPVSERLPEEGINPVTGDYYEYHVTYKSELVTEVRFYTFGDGHWWDSEGIIDENVIAWMPLPEPFTGKGEQE